MVTEGKQRPVEGKPEWGLGNMEQCPEKTVISPVGHNFDRTGLIRSIVMGLRLTEIAAKGYSKDSSFVSYTMIQFVDLCFSQGISPRDFTLTDEDLVNLARGNMREMVHSLNVLIQNLPILPVNTEEMRETYIHARKVLIKA